jgi:hypothetical protein
MRSILATVAPTDWTAYTSGAYLPNSLARCGSFWSGRVECQVSEAPRGLATPVLEITGFFNRLTTDESSLALNRNETVVAAVPPKRAGERWVEGWTMEIAAEGTDSL